MSRKTIGVYLFLFGFFIVTPFLFVSQVYGATGIHQVINFQGKVVDANGLNVSDNTYDFVIKLYDAAGSGALTLYTESWTAAALWSSTMSSAPAAAGESLTYSSNTNESTIKAGQILWNTTKVEAVTVEAVNTSTNVITISPTRQAWAASDTVTNKIYVKDGVFIIPINALNADLSGVDFNTDNIYLGVNFNADGEMLPRIRFKAVPYAMNARKVAGMTVTDTTGTFTLASGKTFTISNTLTFTGTDSTSFTFPSSNGTVCVSGNTCSGLQTSLTFSNGLTNTAGTVSLGGTLTGNTTINDAGFNLIFNGGAGNVAIGNAAPTAKLDVTGTASVSGDLTLGNGSALQPAYGPLTLKYKSAVNTWATGLTIQDTTGNVGIGTTTPTSPFQFLTTVTGTSGSIQGLQARTNYAPSSTSTASVFANNNTFAVSGTADLSGFAGYGAYIQASSSNTNGAGVGTIVGFYGDTYNISSGIVTSAVGVQGRLNSTGTGSITQGHAFRAVAPSFANGGVISNLRGLTIQSQVNTTGGSSTTGGYTSYGVNLTLGTQGDNTSGTNNNYGLYITGNGGTAGSGGVVNNYSLYNNSTATSYFAGNVGIGDTSPLAALTVGSGDLFQVNSSGAIAAAAGITSSGTITFSGFSSNGGPLYTNGSGVLAQTTAGTSTQILHGGTSPSFSSIAAADIGADVLDFTEFKDAMALDATTSIAQAGFDLDLTGNGKLGVGLSSPTSKFHVSNSGLTAIGKALVNYDQYESQDILTASASGTNVYTLARTGATTWSPTTSLTSGNILNIAYPSAMTMTGDLVGIRVDIKTNVTPGSNNQSGFQANLATATNFASANSAAFLSTNNGAVTVSSANTGTWSILNSLIPGMTTQSNASAALNANGVLIQTGNLTQSTGTLTENGVKILATSTAFSSGGTLNGFLFTPMATEPSVGTVNGINIGGITTNGAGTSTALAIGANWDYGAGILSKVGIGTSTPNTWLTVSDSGQALAGKAIAIFDQYENQDIIAASASGTVKWYLTNAGNQVFNQASTIQTTTGALTLQAAGSGTIASVQIGAGGSGSTTPDFLALDVKSDTGDPAGGAEGYMYYNTFDNRFRCYQTSGWTDCITSATGVGADSLDFTEFKDAMALDASTSVAQAGFDFTFTGTGNVGVGNASPIEKLDVTGNATVSGNLTLGNGSVIKPAYGPLVLQYKSAVNTYANALYIQDTTGNVGIGTSNPTSAMHIVTNSVPYLQATRSDNTTDFYVSAFGQTTIRAGIGNYSASLNVSTGSDTIKGLAMRGLTANQSANFFEIQNNLGTVLTSFDESGNLRIGATAPDTGKLNVTGNSYGKALTILNELGDQDVFTASSSGTTRFVIANNGNVGIGTSATPIGRFNVSDSGLSAIGKALAIFDQYESQDIITASASGTKKFALTNGGNLVSVAGANWQPFTDSTTALNVANSSGTAFVTFDSTNSRVGIGDTSPLAALTVGSGDLFQVNSSGAIAAAAGITSSGTITFSGFSSNGGPLYTNASGVLAQTTAGTTTQILHGGTTPSFSSIVAADVGADVLDFTEFKDAMALDATTSIAQAGFDLDLTGNGKLGVGTSSPTSKFHVSNSGLTAIGKALVNYDQYESQDIITASASGTKKFALSNGGNLTSVAGANWQPFTDSTTALNVANSSGTAFVTFDSTNSRVGIGDTSPLAALTVGSGDLFQVNSSGAIAAVVGITNTAGITSTGGIVNLNASSNFAVNIGTGTSTGAVTIGGGSNTFALDSTALDVSTAGVVSGATGITSSGTITFSGLTSCATLTTNSSGVLACGTGPDTATFTDNSSLPTPVDGTSTEYWNDATRPNITPLSSSQTVLVHVYVKASGGSASDQVLAGRIYRNVGSNPTCSSSTLVGETLTTFFTNSSNDVGVLSGEFLDSPATTSNVVYTLCSHTDQDGTSMTLNAVTFTLEVVGADYAENYYTTDASIVPGELVAIDASFPAGVKKTSRAYDSNTIGIVSTSPGKILDDHIGAAFGRPIPIALAGRVPVKVSSENGRIEAGDYLTSSSTPGVAMKATKAGIVVGQAMQGFSGDSIGEIIVFVNTTFYQGLRMASSLPAGIDILQSGQHNGSHDAQVTAEQILATLMTQRQALTDDVNLSEVNADRITATAQVIAPEIVTSLLTADSIRANKIEGLEIMTSNLLAHQFQQLSDADNQALIANHVSRDSAIASSSAFIAQHFGFDADITHFLSDAVFDHNLDVQLNIDAKGQITAGGLVINGITRFKGQTFFASVAEFIDEVVFKKNVNFESTPTFNSDTGGEAIIRAGNKLVNVGFDKEYNQTPIINATLLVRTNSDQPEREASEDATLNNDISFIVTRVTTKGFTIKTNKMMTHDVHFTWSALAVKDAKVSVSRDTIDPSATPTPTVTIVPTSLPSLTPSDTPAPTQPTASTSAQL